MLSSCSIFFSFFFSRRVRALHMRIEQHNFCRVRWRCGEIGYNVAHWACAALGSGDGMTSWYRLGTSRRLHDLKNGKSRRWMTKANENGEGERTNKIGNLGLVGAGHPAPCQLSAFSMDIRKNSIVETLEDSTAVRRIPSRVGPRANRIRRSVRARRMSPRTKQAPLTVYLPAIREALVASG